MEIYQIRSHDGYLFTQSAPDEATAMKILEKRLGFTEIDSLSGKALIYGNIDRQCDCMICEKRIGCPHSGTFRRHTKENGGLGDCPKLKED